MGCRQGVRFTVNGASRTSEKVIKAQNDIINNDAHVFPGPETDSYYDINYRGDEVHFRGDGVTPSPDGHVYSGLIYLAGFWADKIDNAFITQSVPYAAIAPPKVTSVMLPTSTNTTLAGPASVPNAEYNWLIQMTVMHRLLRHKIIPLALAPINLNYHGK